MRKGIDRLFLNKKRPQWDLRAGPRLLPVWGLHTIAGVPMAERQTRKSLLRPCDPDSHTTEAHAID